MKKLILLFFLLAFEVGALHADLSQVEIGCNHVGVMIEDIKLSSNEYWDYDKNITIRIGYQRKRSASDKKYIEQIILTEKADFVPLFFPEFVIDPRDIIIFGYNIDLRQKHRFYSPWTRPHLSSVILQQNLRDINWDERKRSNGVYYVNHSSETLRSHEQGMEVILRLYTTCRNIADLLPGSRFDSSNNLLKDTSKIRPGVYPGRCGFYNKCGMYDRSNEDFFDIYEYYDYAKNYDQCLKTDFSAVLMIDEIGGSHKAAISSVNFNNPSFYELLTQAVMDELELYRNSVYPESSNLVYNEENNNWSYHCRKSDTITNLKFTEGRIQTISFRSVNRYEGWRSSSSFCEFVYEEEVPSFSSTSEFAIWEY